MKGVLCITSAELPIEILSIAELKASPSLAPVVGEGTLLLFLMGIQCKESAG